MSSEDVYYDAKDGAVTALTPLSSPTSGLDDYDQGEGLKKTYLKLL